MNNNLRLATIGLLSAALLSACGASDKSPPATKTADNILTLNGKLSGVTGGNATLENNLASAAVGTDGSFSLALPTGDQMNSIKKDLNSGFLNDFNCKSSLSSSTPGVKAYAFGSLNSNGQQYYDLAADRGLTNVKAGGRVYLYVDAATTISGTLSCSFSGINLTKVSANINAQPGWNVVGLKGENGGLFNLTDFTGSIYNAAKSDGSLWVTGDQLKKQIGL